MTRLESVDKASSTAKNIVTLAAIGLAIWLYYPFFAVLRTELKQNKGKYHVQEFNFLFAKLTLQTN